MAKLLRMPEVAAGATTVVLSEWSIGENTTFAVGAPLVVIETDKAQVEVEAEHPGVLLKMLATPGAQIDVGAAIAVIGDRDEHVPDMSALLTELGVALTPEAVDATTRPVSAAPATSLNARAAAQVSDAGRIFASPLARRLASEAGLELSTVHGTGPGGRIVRRDVEAASQSPASPPPTPAREPAGREFAPTPYTDEPHSRLRRAVATRLTESKQTQPHFYLTATVRADALLSMRAQLNAATASKISVNDLLVKAIGKAHQLVPQMNTIWTPDAIRTFASSDVSIAIASERGLLTPVLREVDRMSISEVAAATKDLIERAQAGKIKQHELEGGSTTISNLGMYGVDEFSAIINPPQSSILAVGAAKQQAVVIDGQLAVASVMRVVLSVDHRPIDGAVAAQWMEQFVSVVENPIRILA